MVFCAEILFSNRECFHLICSGGTCKFLARFSEIAGLQLKHNDELKRYCEGPCPYLGLDVSNVSFRFLINRQWNKFVDQNLLSEFFFKINIHSFLLCQKKLSYWYGTKQHSEYQFVLASTARSTDVVLNLSWSQLRFSLVHLHRKHSQCLQASVGHRNKWIYSISMIKATWILAPSRVSWHVYTAQEGSQQVLYY